MRKLSDSFLQALKDGFLAGITQQVTRDKDLDLQIRNNYLNLYYKGNSLLRLTELNSFRYKVSIHQKFLGDLTISDIDNETTASEFLEKIPHLKENVIKYGNSSLEVEYEQMIIRANNFEPRNNTEYFITDRQYAVSNVGRFDLTGFFWNRNKRRKGQEVPLCFMEIKFALNQDIKDVHQQLEQYYQAIKDNRASNIAEEAEVIFRQKLELGLFDLPYNRVEALKTLTFAKDIEQFQFILILVDYNPNSSHLDLENLRKLPFARQIRVFHSGFGMWQQNVLPL